jgi:hypothetical protein
MSLIEDLRQYRIAKMAIFDWVMTVVGALIIAGIFKLNALIVLIILLVASIPIHMAAGIKTNTNYYLGLDDEPLATDP